MQNFRLVVDANAKDKFKISSLLREYTENRAEIRVVGVFGLVSICLSTLTSTALIVAAVLSNEHVLFLISPALSIFFVVLAELLSTYIINLSIRLNVIEDKVNKIIGESTIVGSLFIRINEDIMEKAVGVYWKRAISIGIIVGLIPFIISLWLGSDSYFREVGPVALLVVLVYGTIAVFVVYFGYKFFVTGDWARIQL
jgi:hypothetical protein